MRPDRPGIVPTSILIAAFLAPWVAAQDDCATAIPISVGSTSGSTAAFSTDTAASCGTLHDDAWFVYVPTCSGTASATVCGPGTASFDSILAAYDGSGGCAGLVPLACNDNTCASRAAISFPVLSGGVYYLALGGVQGASGSFTLMLSCSSLVPHDDCAGALPIGNGLTTGSNLGATASPQTAACSNMGSDVWYAYTAPCTGQADATFCQPGAATFDTVIAVFDGAAACAMPAQIACDDDTCVLRSKASFPVTAGAVYLLSVGGFGGLQGTFSLSLACHAAPGNDDCAGAVPLALGSNGPFSNQYATDGAPPPSSCQPGFVDLWFSFTAPCSAPYRIDTCGAGYDTIMSLRDGCGPGASELACNDNAPLAGCGAASLIDFPAAIGVTYFLRVSGAAAGAGSFNVNVAPRFVLSYDSPGGPGSVAFSIQGGPVNGFYLDVITFNPGAFPNGTFFGLDITVEEVLYLINLGPPFLSTLDSCGGASIPFIVAPFLSGYTFYSVALATDVVLTLPPLFTPAVSHTIP